MKLAVDTFGLVGINVRVNLGRGNVSMAEHFLNNTQRHAVSQQMTGE